MTDQARVEKFVAHVETTEFQSCLCCYFSLVVGDLRGFRIEWVLPNMHIAHVLRMQGKNIA